MGLYFDYIHNDQIQIGEHVSTDSKKGIALKDGQGKDIRIANDRVLFEHRGPSLAEVTERLERLAAEIDVPLLREMLIDGAELSAQPAAALSSIYFDRADPTHAAAMFRALHSERISFRRKALDFAPRTADEVRQLQQQLEAEARAAQEHEGLSTALKQSDLAPLAERLERWLRGNADRPLERALSALHGEQARELIHWALVDQGLLPATSDPEFVAANLTLGEPPAAASYAEGLPSFAEAANATGSFSIDDPQTEEVDDVLSAAREGDLVRVDIDIADASAFVLPDDPVDLVARRRATTAYLPTATIYMLPKRIGCELASLRAETTRPVVRTSAWIDAEGKVMRFELSRRATRIERRLSYTEADALLQDGAPSDPTVQQLQLLASVAAARRERRLEKGALLLSRQEWKVQVGPDATTIEANEIEQGSPSRALVAEMMVLANELAASYARDNALPVIYRTQSAPSEPLPQLDPQDPTALFKLRGLIKPATLSLQAQPHWGLGLSAYTQITSPLRRYGDLVQQRQICAALESRPIPYTSEQLLELLATIEPTEHEMKRLESALNQRWSLEFLSRQRALPQLARVVAQSKGGYRAAVQSCGAEGFLATRESHTLGELVPVAVDRVDPRKKILRLVPRPLA